MYKVLLLDLDGTLLSSKKTISDENKEAIKKARDAGVMVSIGSGRPALDIYNFIEELDLKDSYHVADNGLSVFKYGEKPDRYTYFSDGAYKHILDELFRSNANFAVLAEQSDDYLIHKDSVDKLVSAIKKPGANSLGAKEVTKEELYNADRPYKFLTFIESEDEYNFAKELEKEVEMAASIVSTGFMNYMPGSVNKFTGAQTLGKMFGISTENMAAIGDEENDYGIIKNIGLSVAPANASSEIKDLAKVVLNKTNDEHAVAELIYNYILV